jgi:ATPase subunit of ABC transporter with duplicated ATPase domains
MQIRGQYLRRYLGGLLSLRDEKAMEALCREYIALLDIKCTGTRQKAKELSGGNQQKVCLAKAFAMKPDLLFVSEPTRGIDVGAKRLVLDTLRRYNMDYGTTIVMISSELEELRSTASPSWTRGRSRASSFPRRTSPSSDCSWPAWRRQRQLRGAAGRDQRRLRTSRRRSRR